MHRCWFCNSIQPLLIIILCLEQGSILMHRLANPGYSFIWHNIPSFYSPYYCQFLLETLVHGLKDELIVFLIPPLSGLCEKVHDPLSQTVTWLWTGSRFRIPVLCKKLLYIVFLLLKRFSLRIMCSFSKDTKMMAGMFWVT